MATKQASIEAAKRALKRNPTKRYFIYRVGAAWMYTPASQEETQSQYKRPLKEWQEIEQR